MARDQTAQKRDMEQFTRQSSRDYGPRLRLFRLSIMLYMYGDRSPVLPSLSRTILQS